MQDHPHLRRHDRLPDAPCGDDLTRLTVRDAFEITIDPSSILAGAAEDYVGPADLFPGCPRLNLRFILADGHYEQIVEINEGRPTPGIQWRHMPDNSWRLVMYVPANTLPPGRPRLTMMIFSAPVRTPRDRRPYRLARTFPIPLHLEIIP